MGGPRLFSERWGTLTRCLALLRGINVGGNNIIPAGNSLSLSLALAGRSVADALRRECAVHCAGWLGGDARGIPR